MRKGIPTLVVLLAAASVRASWYWPFGSGDEVAQQERISSILAPASELMDDAADLAADNKFDEAVDKYREALVVIERIKYENRGRIDTPEFTSVHNKEATATAAIDALLLGQARQNAKAVAVTDTTELEKRFVAKRAGLASSNAKKAPETAGKADSKRIARFEEILAKNPANRKARLALIGEWIAVERYDEARVVLDQLLMMDDKDAAALNLAAACFSAQGDVEGAKAALGRAMTAVPDDFTAYYNMAELKLDTGAKKAEAERYYRMGRRKGGPRDLELEERLR